MFQAITINNTQRPLNWTPPQSIESAVDTFVGYLLLDAWIGNGDRHHENWGLVSAIDRTIHLAPTYDHASSLGRELSDAKRQERLQNKTVGAYLKKNYSAFYAQASDSKSLTTLAAFQTDSWWSEILFCLYSGRTPSPIGSKFPSLVSISWFLSNVHIDRTFLAIRQPSPQ